MAANIGDVMDDIGTALSLIAGLRVYDFPPKSAQPPFAFVDMPDVINFDSAMSRGSDRMTINVVVGLPDVVDRETRDRAAEYAAGSGSKSIKATLDAALGQGSRVVSADFRPVQLAGTVYAGIVFQLDINF